jgi:F-type H+-transporting ATPase subunit a
MGHGISWLNFIPGYQQLEHFIQGIQARGWLFGEPVVIQHVASAMLVALLLFALSFKARSELKASPDGNVIPQPKVSVLNVIEAILEALYSQMRQLIGEDAKRYFPVVSTLALFIFFSNVLGIIPGFNPPTDHWGTTFACGGFVFIYYNYHGMRQNGLAHIGHMANPTGESWGWFLAPLMFPIELVSHCVRPASLAVRLATNLAGDHKVLFAFLGLVPIIVPIPFLILGLLVSVIQTLVFVLLTMIYIGLAVEDAHHGDEHHHGEEAAAHA